MKPSSFAGAIIVLVATILLLAPSLGAGTTIATSQSAPIADTPAPDVPPEAPAGASTGLPAPAPAPAVSTPHVIYVQLPPQTIYVIQAPAAAPATSPAPASIPAAPPAPAGCHPAYAGVCLDASALDYDCAGTVSDGPQYALGPFRVTGIDVFALDPDGNGIGCDLPSTATPQPALSLPATALPTNTPPATATPRPTSTPRPTATPVLARGQVIVNFAGAPIQRPTASVAFAVTPGARAWDAVRQAIGVSNLAYQDYGGSLGIFITGFYGAVAQGNHFWELYINGQAAQVGVSAYIVGDGDILEFRYSSF